MAQRGLSDRGGDEIRQAQQEIIDEFSLFDDWMGRYEYLIDLGRSLGEFPDEWRNEDNRIRGCLLRSQAWPGTWWGWQLHFVNGALKYYRPLIFHLCCGGLSK